MSLFGELFPENTALATQELKEMDELLSKIAEWKDSRFIDQMAQFEAVVDEEAITAMFIRALEAHGYQGVPEDSAIINAYFDMVLNVACLTFHLIMDEKVRL